MYVLETYTTPWTESQNTSCLEQITEISLNPRQDETISITLLDNQHESLNIQFAREPKSLQALSTNTHTHAQ